jgi:DNA-damage-inducible protein J
MAMDQKIVVHARVDEQVKREAEAVLSDIGLTVSDAFRLMIVRIAAEKALPFEPLIPNKTTIEAIGEARHDALPRFNTVDALMDDLRKGD